jgi:hypothetical protein
LDKQAVADFIYSFSDLKQLKLTGMQPINKPERRKTFLNFLLLFAVCIIIIITTVFFSIQVPFKQNDQLRRDMSLVEKDREFSNKFMNEMSGISAMLDTINTKATKPELLDGQVSENIKKLNAMIDTDSIYNKPLYKNMVLSLADLSAAKKQLRELTGKDANIGELQKQKDDLSQQFEAAKNEILNLKQQIFMLQQQRPN